jgi:hypothetical protein
MGFFKIERTPLLGPGFHVMSLEEIRQMAVERFESAPVRLELYSKLSGLVDRLTELNIPCDLWIDGSFVTEEAVPSDIDIGVCVNDGVMQALSPTQDNFLTKLSCDHEAFIPGLDTFVFAGYWIGHPRHGADEDDGFSKTTISWSQQFGKGRDDWLKGIVLLPILENKVGLLIRS